MKKLLFVCVAIAASLAFNTAKAQTQKVGYFDEQLTLSWFPGLVGKVDTAMYSYQNDSIAVEYQYRVNDYQRKDSLFRKDSATMPAKARELAMRELNQMRVVLVNWQQYAQQMSDAKQDQLLLPYKQRMFEALTQIIAEQKYTYVLNASALSQYAVPPVLDNLSIRVALRLKLPLPKDYEDAWKKAGGTAGTGTSAPASGPVKK